MCRSGRSQARSAHPYRSGHVYRHSEALLLRLPSVRLAIVWTGLPGSGHGNPLLLRLLFVLLDFLETKVMTSQDEAEYLTPKHSASRF